MSNPPRIEWSAQVCYGITKAKNRNRNVRLLSGKQTCIYCILCRVQTMTIMRLSQCAMCVRPMNVNVSLCERVIALSLRALGARRERRGGGGLPRGT